MAYAFETIFTTLCVFATIRKDDAFEYGGNFNLKSVVQIHQYCMQRTMETFLDAAIFFALAVNVAGLRAITRRKQTLYASMQTANIAVFSIAPVLTILSLRYNQLRRRTWRVSLAIIATTMATVVVICGTMYGFGTLSNWFFVCYNPNIPSFVWVTILTLMCWLEYQVILGPACYFLTLFFRYQLWRVRSKQSPNFFVRLLDVNHGRRSARQQRREQRKHPILAQVWRVIVPDDQPFAGRLAVICYIMTCMLLGMILYIRLPMQKVAGKHFKENELGFGQILAALMWLPVVVEYFQIAVCRSLYYFMGSDILRRSDITTDGSIKGLKGRLPDTYTVVRNPTDNPRGGAGDGTSPDGPSPWYPGLLRAQLLGVQSP